MMFRNVEFDRKAKISPWRKAAIGTWPSVGDPSMYGSIELNAEKALAYVEKLKKESGEKITITHLVGLVIGKAFKEHHELNRMIRWGRLYQRKSIDAYYLVATDTGGKDLSGTVVRDVDTKNIVQIAKELNQKVTGIRKKETGAYARMKGIVSLTPGFLSQPILVLFGFVFYTLNLYLPFLGIPKDSFGSFFISSVNGFGLEDAYAPLVPYSRTPAIITITDIKDKPVVIDGVVKSAKMVRLCATIDHRVIDGLYGGKLISSIRKYFENPELLG